MVFFFLFKIFRDRSGESGQARETLLCPNQESHPQPCNAQDDAPTIVPHRPALEGHFETFGGSGT